MTILDSFTTDTLYVSQQLLLESAAELQSLVWSGVASNANDIDDVVGTMLWLSDSILRDSLQLECDIALHEISPTFEAQTTEPRFSNTNAIVAFREFAMHWRGFSRIAVNANEFSETLNSILPSLFKELRVSTGY